MTERAIVDRFEGDKAVLELNNRKMLTIFRTSLAAGVREGDVVCCENHLWLLDTAATEARRLKISQLLHKNGV